MKKFSKGMSFDFDKESDHLRHIKVKLMWEYDKSKNNGLKLDADLTLAVLQTVGKNNDGTIVKNIFAEDEGYLVFYNSPLKDKVKGDIWTPGKEIHHTGDCQTGEEGEEADIFLDKLHTKVDEIPIIATIHKGEERNQNWGSLKGRLQILNHDTGEILGEYDFGSEIPAATASHVGSIVRTENGFKYESIGSGFNASLSQFIDNWVQEPDLPI